jgi:hypothetical protein
VGGGGGGGIQTKKILGEIPFEIVLRGPHLQYGISIWRENIQRIPIKDLIDLKVDGNEK